jgi:hypothetical protein
LGAIGLSVATWPPVPSIPEPPCGAGGTTQKTNGLRAILVKIEETFDTICGVTDGSFVARLLAPRPATDDAEEEELTKNNSSVILHLSLKIAGEIKARYLL